MHAPQRMQPARGGPSPPKYGSGTSSPGALSLKNTPTRVLGAEHLVAIMLQTGREKDYARAAKFLEEGMVNVARLTALTPLNLTCVPLDCAAHCALAAPLNRILNSKRTIIFIIISKPETIQSSRTSVEVSTA